MDWKAKLKEINAQLEAEDIDILQNNPDMWPELLSDPSVYDWTTISKTKYIPEDLLIKILEEDEAGDVWGDFDWEAMLKLNVYNPDFVTEHLVDPGYLDMQEAYEIYKEIDY